MRILHAGVAGASIMVDPTLRGERSEGLGIDMDPRVVTKFHSSRPAIWDLGVNGRIALMADRR